MKTVSSPSVILASFLLVTLGVSTAVSSDVALEWGSGTAIAPDEPLANDGGVDRATENPLIGPTIDNVDSPAPRASHGMAYDTESDQVILFGGATGSSHQFGDTWAYDFDLNTWTNMNPAGGPSPRSAHAMTYDAVADRVILFGGVNVGGGTTFVELNDTWSYDFNTNTWENRNPVVAPSPRLGHRMAYDIQSGHTVLLSGHRGQGLGTLFHDTWAYDFFANEWTDMASSPNPAAGNDGSLVYDAESDRIIMFGGDGPGRLTFFDDTWSYDFESNTWSDSNPSQRPSPRSLHGMAYDADSDRTILFGGDSGSGGNDETWALHLNLSDWREMSPSSRPSGRLAHGMAYDGDSDRVILFGGWSTFFGLTNDETWAYDFDTNTWTPKIVAPSAPLSLQAVARVGHVDLSWGPPSFDGSSPILGYRIFRGTGGLPSPLIDLGPVLTYQDTSVNEGTTYYYRVSAVNGEREGPQSSQVSGTVPDVTNPSIAITSPAEGAVVATQSVAVTGTAADNVALGRVELSADGTNWVLATGTTSWSGGIALAEGQNTVRARATDRSGNQAEATVAIVVDVTSPTVAITSTTYPVGTATISGSAADNLAVAKVEVSTDNLSWVVADGTTSWSATVALPAESFTLYARATDTAGNFKVAFVHVDRPPPPQGNLLLLAGIAGAVAAAGVGVGLLVRRRRRAP